MMDEIDKERLLAALPSWQKIAVLMVALGDDLAAELMRQLDDGEATELTRALVELKRVPKDVQDRVLVEFEEALKSEAPPSGGIDYAHQVLVRALGAERAEAMIERAVGGETSGFARLREIDPALAAPHIAKEHPQTIALILSQLEAEQAASILVHFSAAVQSEVAHRIATLGPVDPVLLEEVEESLNEALKGTLGSGLAVEGSAALAAILNAGGSILERGILERMDHQDPEIAESVRRRMLVFADLARLPSADMQVLLGHVDMDDVRLALRAADKGVRDAFFGAMTQRRRARLAEDIDALGPTRAEEVRAAQDRIAGLARELEERKMLRVPRSGEDETYV